MLRATRYFATSTKTDRFLQRKVESRHTGFSLSLKRKKNLPHTPEWLDILNGTTSIKESK